MENTLQITVPTDVPAPKFALFQKVRCIADSRGYNQGGLGTVVGLHYTCALDALKEGLPISGWTYEVSYLFGKTLDQALREEESEWTLTESQLEAFEW